MIFENFIKILKALIEKPNKLVQGYATSFSLLYISSVDDMYFCKSFIAWYVLRILLLPFVSHLDKIVTHGAIS